MLPEGLYEQVINQALEEELAGTDRLPEKAPIDEAEAAKVLSKYIAQLAEERLQQLQDAGCG